MKKTLDDYMTLDAILDQLIRIRLKVSTRRHDAHFLRDISTDAPDPVQDVSSPVEGLLPPRREWWRPPLKNRNGLERSSVYYQSIRKVVLARRANGTLSNTEWGRRLLALVCDVQGAVSGIVDYRIAMPRIIFNVKPGGGVRPIAMYDRLLDRLVTGLAARYFRGLFDSLFVQECHAFRIKGHSHHFAVESILKFRESCPDQYLYVAECDIKKFYDTINHRVAMDALQKTMARHEQQNPDNPADPRAVSLFCKYLDHYSFRDTVLPAFNQIKNEKGCSLEWLTGDELKKLYEHPESERIGIPQGGALSLVIGNLVLDAADRAVLGGAQDASLCYARFCDDMLILHRDKGECAAALDRYMAALHVLKLSAHTPVDMGVYGKSFFECKSKQAYAWGPIEENVRGVSPWVSFVGYQVRHDGHLRIRKDSVKRELMQQVAAADAVIHLAKSRHGTLRLRPDIIMKRLKARMVARAVGRVDLKVPEGGNSGVCWADGFRLLGEHSHETRQLKSLDRMQERQWRRVRRCLDAVVGSQGLTNVGGGSFKRRYYGAPYSHYGSYGRAQKKHCYSCGSWKEACFSTYSA